MSNDFTLPPVVQLPRSRPSERNFIFELSFGLYSLEVIQLNYMGAMTHGRRPAQFSAEMIATWWEVSQELPLRCRGYDRLEVARLKEMNSSLRHHDTICSMLSDYPFTVKENECSWELTTWTKYQAIITLKQSMDGTEGHSTQLCGNKFIYVKKSKNGRKKPPCKHPDYVRLKY
ncbi:hypothetical protein ACRALDRAFT_206452 [Sodiomyces alcalophilus JCM 7366]|uniref:uncharacterized protein n=1 Tax=Sodiomyces alcalophilus JCM 7366 TaxID=591952 RepID=UPI0039B5CF40